MDIIIRENKVHHLPNGATIPTRLIKTLSRDHFGEVPADGDYIRWDGVLYEVIRREWRPGISGEVSLIVRAVDDIDDARTVRSVHRTGHPNIEAPPE